MRISLLRTLSASYTDGLSIASCLQITFFGIPLCAFARKNMPEVHCVDFLERPLAGFHEEEIDENGCKQIARSEDIAVPEVNSRYDEWSEEC
jgi:hypothetical protein